MPMGGNTTLCVLVHSLSPNLHLDGSVARPNDRRMQRLVPIRLGIRNVIIEFVRYVLPKPVHDT